MCMCVCVYIYIYVVGLGMCFFVIKVQYTLVVIKVQSPYFEQLFIASTNCVQLDLSNIDWMEVVIIVEWFL